MHYEAGDGVGGLGHGDICTEMIKEILLAKINVDELFSTIDGLNLIKHQKRIMKHRLIDLVESIKEFDKVYNGSDHS